MYYVAQILQGENNRETIWNGFQQGIKRQVLKEKK